MYMDCTGAAECMDALERPLYMDVQVPRSAGMARNDRTRYCAIDSRVLSSEPDNLIFASIENPEFFQLNRLEGLLSSSLTSHTFPNI